MEAFSPLRDFCGLDGSIIPRETYSYILSFISGRHNGDNIGNTILFSCHLALSRLHKAFIVPKNALMAELDALVFGQMPRFCAQGVQGVVCSQRSNSNFKMAGVSGSFRQLEDKPCSTEILYQRWSPKMDLLALVTIEGEVWLQRLSWKRVWTISTAECRALSVAWRPDGKILAVAFNDGKIKLFDIENAECIHKTEIESTPSSMDWIEEGKEKVSTGDRETSLKNLPFFVEKSELYLPSLSHLPKSAGALFSKETSQEESEDPKKLKCLPEELSVLVVGDDRGKIHMYLYGIFLCASLDTADVVQQHSEFHAVTNACVSHDLKVLSAVVKSPVFGSDKQSVSLVLYDTGLLSMRSRELAVVAKKMGEVTCLMDYFDNTLQSMSDAWEDILLEMDTKLTEFAAERLTAGSSVSSEFLTLLTRGVTSPELQSFLLHDLTEKGLKKLGHSIENSYTSIQNLALKHLQCVTQSLLFHVTEIHGMSRWHEEFGDLGLSEFDIQTVITSLGSIMLKTQELVLVIETSLKSFKAFFQWLYYAILSLSDAEIPDFVKQRSQQEVMLLSGFIQDQLVVNKQGKFTLERVGQYFDPKSLSVKPPFGNNDWTKFVESHPTLRSSPLLIPDKVTDSLVTLSEQLHEHIKKAFAEPIKAISKSISCWCCSALCEVSKDEDSSFHVAQKSTGFPLRQLVVFPDDRKLCLVSIRPNERRLFFARICIDNLPCDTEPALYSFSDVMFYDSEYLSVLLQQQKVDDGGDEDDVDAWLSILAQVPYSWLEDKDFVDVAQVNQTYINLISQPSPISVGPRITHFRKLVGMRASSLSVSGTRKVACVLSVLQRNVRLFDMDAEDEEAEDEETENEELNNSFEEEQ